MKNKGTGWIPDYPDIKDYTLDSGEIQNLANKVQSQGATASIDELAQKIYDTLKEFIDSQQNNQLTQLRDKLEEKILGELRFVTVELHSVIEPEMADSEVLLIKNYLQRIISTWRTFEDVNYQPVITNTTFDTATKEAVTNILKNQRYLRINGFLDRVDKDDMEALKLLAHGLDLDRDLKPFEKLIQINCQKYQLEIDKYKDTENLPKNPKKLNLLCQGLLTVYLLPVIKKLRELDELQTEIKNLKHEQVQKKIKDQKTQIAPVIQQLKTAVDDIIQNKDFIIELLNKFKKSLISLKYFTESELRELTDFANTEQGLNNKIIGPLNSLWENYKQLDETDIIEYPPKIITELKNNLKEFERIMGLLYKAYPPEIPSKIFQKTEMSISPPIPKLVVELFKKELGNHSNQRESKQLNQEDEVSIERLIGYLKNNSLPDKILPLIVEILAQILMPLGQYSNLNEAVEKAIEKILNLRPEKQNNFPGIRGLIRETIEEYNFGMARNYSLMMELDLENLISKALEKFNREGKLSKMPINPSQKLFRKPLFEITSLEPKSSHKIKVETKNPEKSSSSKSNISQQQKNNLEFPLSSDIRQRIQAFAFENEECSNKSIFLSLPEFVDLTYWCSPIEDQGLLNSCTAHAGVALMEYAEKKIADSYTDASPLFLYRVTRNLMQREGDSGASVRDTIKAMVAFGVCPEEHWPYNENNLDEEPTAFCYSFAENYKTIKYFRLDYGQISPYTLLSQVKVLLASEIPCIFGFTLYNSVYDEVNTLRGHIPLPNKRSKVIGGHTVVAVGYHDSKIIENENSEPSKGALLIRNSWGTSWGQGGYGWLPYDYIMKGLTADWWSILKAEWLATKRFGAGASAWNPNKGDTGGVTKSDQ
jgi:C1A family cysteine protease